MTNTKRARVENLGQRSPALQKDLNIALRLASATFVPFEMQSCPDILSGNSDILSELASGPPLRPRAISMWFLCSNSAALALFTSGHPDKRCWLYERTIELANSEDVNMLFQLWSSDEGQDIAEYAVMLAVILVLVVGTVRIIGSNANNVFSNVSSSLQ